MIEPEVFIAYAPRGPGVMCALFYFDRRDDVYGWYTGSRAHEHPASFFVLEQFFTPHETHFYRSEQDDVYGGWVQVRRGGESKIDRPVPVPEPLCHELEHLQDAFMREWLVYADDPRFEAEAAAYRSHEMPAREIVVRSEKIGKLQTGKPVWTYASPRCDMNIVGYLQRHWALDYDSAD